MPVRVFPPWRVLSAAGGRRAWIMQLAAAARPTFPVDLLLDAITNPRARTANGTLNGTALCMACTADAPCCRKSCGAAAGRIMHPFRFPPGNGYFKSKPCRAAPGLGLDHALLPVTHIGGPNKGPTDSGGLWFYYAPGCSDFLWDMGRTLLSRNRVHLAVQLEQQHGGGDERAAVGRVAEWVRRVYPKWRALDRVCRTALEPQPSRRKIDLPLTRASPAWHRRGACWASRTRAWRSCSRTRRAA